MSFSGYSKNNKGVADFSLEEKNDVQMLVLLKYTQITSEIMTGNGRYLDALLYLIKQSRPLEEKNIVIDNLKRILLSSRDIFHFSMQVKKYSAL